MKKEMQKRWAQMAHAFVRGVSPANIDAPAAKDCADARLRFSFMLCMAEL